MMSRQSSLLLTLSQAHNHPQKIGPWRLGKTLGRGATGRVLLGVHQTTGQKAAVKVVSKLELNEEYEQPKDRKGGLPYGIEREIIIMKLLTHPNVLRLYDVWETSKALYLVLEYVEGGELFDLLVERGPLGEREAVKYFRQIILGTAYCHALGICHRDLKPENLLLDGLLNVKLADFGMAALESNGKLLETSCGSPHYAAPEIVSGLKYHGAASDVWSCGVILFALLTGRLPFDDENIRNLLLKVQAGSFEMPSDISPEAQDLIWRMLVVDPMDRLSMAQILHHKLLKKYPVPNDDLISVKSLPHPETAYKSLGSRKNIDKQILENLTILWHQRSEEDIVKALLKEGSNPEKTFYALLLRYRHSQDDSALNPPDTPLRKLPRSTSTLSHRSVQTPRRGRNAPIASNSRNRPVSFQRRYGARNSVIGSASSSPYKSPRKSPYKSPHKSPRGHNMSPVASPRKRRNQQAPTGPLPRNIYNEIMAANPQKSLGSIPPTLPSKDSIYAGDTPMTDTAGFDKNDAVDTGRPSVAPTVPVLGAAPTITKNAPTAAAKMSRRKSIRQLLTTGLKRNSITVKLLSTYAKLSSETDWEYMDKQTKRTSATFGTLCDKIFNHEEYDQDDELLIDEEERKAREYEKLMELERKKHEAELKARKELAKQKRRQQRRSLFSLSKKLAITVTEDSEKDNNSDHDVPTSNGRPSAPPRALSEGAAVLDELTSADIDAIKRRSVTQPIPRRRLTPVLTRRPVSRLDPLWIAHENKEVTRAHDALEAEFKDMQKQRRKANRESMVSFGYDEDRTSKNSEYESTPFSLPEPKTEDINLSEEYMSEIRKSRLLNSQMNINGHLAEKRLSVSKNKRSEERKTLIGSVNIPKVTRRSSAFTNSNKRLSLLSVKSTKESYRDLNSFLDTHNEDLDENELIEEEQFGTIPGLRTSFADRLDRAGQLPEVEEDEDAAETASVMDFEEHLANKRSSYYAGSKAANRRSMIPKEVKDHENAADYTFADDDNNAETKREPDGAELFDQIKLPDSKRPDSSSKSKRNHGSAGQSQAPAAHLPQLPQQRPPKAKPEKKYGQLEAPKPQPKPQAKGPLVDSTNTQPDAPQKRNMSLFKKLGWGSRKLLETENKQLPSPAESIDEKRGLFTRWFSSGSHSYNEHRYKTILPRQEMMTALFALLKSWSSFGLKDLKKDMDGFGILGTVSSQNSFNFKSCKFRIQIVLREMNQKSEISCIHVKGSSGTSLLMFKEIKRVLEKEGVMDS